MNSFFLMIIIFCCLVFEANTEVKAQKMGGYVVVTSENVKADKGWMEVVATLQKRHKATVLYYAENIAEVEDALRELSPRYVAFVEKPERLNREYVMEGHRMSRRIDADIYADYLWGIITGYTPADALRMLERCAKPFVVCTALNTTVAMSDGRHFDRMAYMSDGGEGAGWWGEKLVGELESKKYYAGKWEILGTWVKKYKELDPDVLITSSHATERNLEMPFSVGNLKSKSGRLFADFMTPEFLDGTSHPRVYFAAGNCLIGNIDNNPESMAVAWLSGMNATSMVGYVVTTWYGRNGWGGLKYWASNAGRLTLAQAIYLNQQDMLHTEYCWDPKILKVEYPFTEDSFGEQDEFKRIFEKTTGKKATKDQMGFVHDRNVLAFYGDPAWDVKLQPVGKPGYQVTFKVRGKKCYVIICTNDYFNGDLMRDDKLKQEHVSDIPFAYYFPKRLKNPRLAAGQSWDVALAEDFILLYNCDFEKNKSYTIELDIK